MKTIIQALVFDKELVHHLKEVNAGKGLLYTQLVSGKITLQEYLQAVKP